MEATSYYLSRRADLLTRKGEGLGNKVESERLHEKARVYRERAGIFPTLKDTHTTDRTDDETDSIV